MHSACTYTYVRSLTYVSSVWILHEQRIQRTDNQRISFAIRIVPYAQEFEDRSMGSINFYVVFFFSNQNNDIRIEDWQR